jgi:hypothetical protein
MNPEKIAVLSLMTIFLSSVFGEGKGMDQTHPIPVKVDVEIMRTNQFVKFLIFCKNESKEPQKIKLKVLITKQSDGNLSQIAQAKELYLQAYEYALPFISELMAKPEDIYEIKIMIFDKEGRLIAEKSHTSESLKK